MGSSHHENDRTRVLYEASYRGSVSTLNELIQQDPLILSKISRTTFPETPLHISALLGHLDFTKSLTTLKPQLALELDSSRSTALHLASAEGHNDIVKDLLQVYEQACLVLDEEGRIPLHYAAMRGRIEVVRELIRAKPESLSILDNGKTVFHLCVTYNHLETLKALVEMELSTSELLNLRDSDGKNTILHLAIMLKQVETVRYLLSNPKIREAASLEKEMGFRVHDIIERNPKDLKRLEIQIMLMNAGIKSSEKTGIDTQPPTSIPPKKKGWRKILESRGNLLRHKGDRLEEMRGTLSVVATVIATIAFQAVMNPPGGSIQQKLSQDSPLACFKDPYLRNLCPGEAVAASRFPKYFHIYLICNTISFIASLSVTLLLVSGLPLKHKSVLWALSIGMCITITALALAYLYGLLILTPDSLFCSAMIMFKISLWTWIGLLGLVGVYLTVHFVIWLVNKRMKKLQRQKSMSLRNGQIYRIDMINS